MSHSLAARIATDHLRARMAADVTGRHLHALPGAPSPVLPEAPRPVPVQSPSTAHVGHLPVLDAQMRVNAKKVTDALGWLAGADLIAEVTGPGAVTVRPFDPDRQAPGQTPVSLDAQHRLTLSSTVRGTLNLTPGDQVLVIGLPALARVELRSASAALAAVTGLLTAVPEPSSAAESTSGTRRGPRPAWRGRAANAADDQPSTVTSA